MPLPTFAKVTTPFGDDVVQLAKMSGREALSRAFQYDLELYSTKDDLNMRDVLGQSITVELEVAGDNIRHFHGHVVRFSRAGEHGRYIVYNATLRPWPWLLSQSADCYIFQKMTVPDVIKKVFRDYGFSDFEESLSQKYRTWEYVVQYRESAFNFVCRLMEQEGIYFYFKHEKSAHTLVIADSYAAHDPAPGYEKIPYFPPTAFERRERDHIHAWHVEHSLQPKSYMLRDFEFTTPKADLSVRSKVADNLGQFEVYDYPGEYPAHADGEAYARIRMEQLASEREVISASGTTRGLGAGHLFELDGFPSKEQNREYLVTATSFELDLGLHESGDHAGGRTFLSSITTIPSNIPFRPARQTPRPEITGPQTAIVVGKAGQEIWTDRYGRVKVQFHWDREGKKDENSSCWVRVAQVWAGANWGAMHIPRIGQEVVVEFLEGDPDRPLITGRVYNSHNMPPYDLTANQTQSGIKSRSTKEGTAANFNELRFEDKKGEEQVFIQAERNMDTLVKNDQTLTVQANRTKSVVVDETTDIGGNRTERVVGNESIEITGARNEKVVETETILVGQSRNTAITLSDTLQVGQGYFISIGAGSMLDVKGSHGVTVGQGQTTKVKGSDSMQVDGAQNIVITGSRSAEIKGNESVKAASRVVVDAGDEITLKAGAASLTLKKNGDILVNGKTINMKGSDKISIRANSDVLVRGAKNGQN